MSLDGLSNVSQDNLFMMTCINARALHGIFNAIEMKIMANFD